MPLTEREARFFDVFGYLAFPGLFAREAEDITRAFEELFSQKIAATKGACARARAEMGWPARRG